MTLTKKNLWLLSGIPASGKTTKAKELLIAWPNTKYVSRDEIRFSILNYDDEYFAKEKDVFQKFIVETQDGIDNYDNTIADATFLNWASRKKFLKKLRHLDKVNVNVLYFETDLEVCLHRNSQREGLARVPDGVVMNMWNIREHPNNDPYHYHIIGEVVANGESVFN